MTAAPGGWRRCRPLPIAGPPGTERGSATVLMVAVMTAAMMLALVVADIGLLLAGRATAAAAADAAALAAAPVTFHGFGTSATPAAEAQRFAAYHSMTVTSCDCPVDRSWDRRTVTVVVAGAVDLVVFGNPTVSAAATAEFDPTKIVVTSP